VEGLYNPALHLAIGNLKQGDATKNGLPGTFPYTDFFSKSGDIIQGANLRPRPYVLQHMWRGHAHVKNVILRYINWCASSCVTRTLQDEPLITKSQENLPHELAVV
jgi:hypothetical protein